jgi:hypothetical protein
VPLDEVFRNGEGRWWFNVLMHAQHGMLRMLPRMFAMQWVFVARGASLESL